MGLCALEACDGPVQVEEGQSVSLPSSLLLHHGRQGVRPSRQRW